MTQRFTVACVQNCAENDLQANLDELSTRIRAACGAGAALVCLPECCSLIEVDDARMLAVSLPEEGHPALTRFQGLARELGVWLVLGSLMIRDTPDKVHNRSYLIDPEGGIVARYDKLHLFDVQLRDDESYRESAFVAPGEAAVLARTPWGALGLSVCYDLRFAGLYRALAQAGAAFLSIPAAFTLTTGRAHWHVLVRARAIETGCYVFAPNQCGTRSFGRATFGHSLIVDPWGEVLADGGEAPGFVTAEVDPARVQAARKRVPALEHDRPFVVHQAAARRPRVA